MPDVDLGAVARLVGEPARAAMLTALLDGRALTAGELARLAGVAPATASAHLGRLLDGGLVRVAASGRHRYYALAGVEVAHVLEALAVVSPPLPARSLRRSAAADALRPARLCYDHLAGELGVRIFDRLVALDALRLRTDGLELTEGGAAWFAVAGIELPSPASGVGASHRRPLARACLDWTERRHHLAGACGAALAGACLDRGWVVRRAPGERGLHVTDTGAAALDALLA